MQDNILTVERLEAKKIEHGKTFFLVFFWLQCLDLIQISGEMGWLWCFSIYVYVFSSCWIFTTLYGIQNTKPPNNEIVLLCRRCRSPRRPSPKTNYPIQPAGRRGGVVPLHRGRYLKIYKFWKISSYQTHVCDFPPLWIRNPYSDFRPEQLIFHV